MLSRILIFNILFLKYFLAAFRAMLNSGCEGLSPCSTPVRTSKLDYSTRFQLTLLLRLRALS